MSPELERELRGLQVEWPATPDIASAVAARIAGETPGSPARLRWRVSWQPAWAHALAIVLAGFAVVMAVSPSARSAILEFLGLKSVKIERREPTATPRAAAPLGSDLGLGERLSLAEARREVRFPVLVPSELGEPDAVYLGVLGVGVDAVHLLYGSKTGFETSSNTGATLLISQLPATFGELIEKSIGNASRATRLRVDGAEAYFLEGAHGFGFVQRDGSDGAYEQQRLAGNTLLVEREGMLFRIEGEITRAQALAVFRSLEEPP